MSVDLLVTWLGPWGAAALGLLLTAGVLVGAGALEQAFAYRGRHALGLVISTPVRAGALGGLALWMSEAVGLSSEDVVDWLPAALILLVGGWLSWRLADVLARRAEGSDRPYAATVMSMAVRWGGLALVVVAAAESLGIDLTALLATAGVVGVAVGLAAQKSLGNVVAGVFLLIDRPFEVGQTIVLDGHQGSVVQIGLLSTRIRTFDSLVVRFPNEDVLAATIVNYSDGPARRLEIAVRLPLDVDTERVVAVLTDALTREPRMLLEPAPSVRLVDLAGNGLTLSVRPWVARESFLDGRDAAIACVLRALREEGIQPLVPAYEVHRDA